MNYQQFVTALKEGVEHLLDNDMCVCIHTALKNNGHERTGLTISDKKVNLSPTIYLEEFYKRYQNGDSVEDITENILNIYREVKFEHSWQVHTISDFEISKEKIVYKIIYAPENELLLQTLPHLCFLDFAIVYYILFEVDEKGTATVPVTEDLIRLWETSLDEIAQLARKNTPKLLPAVFKPMRVVVDELLGNPCENEFQADDIMFVLTNSLRNFGAACMLYHDSLQKIGDFLKENFYILPSSIHEVIIIPESQAPDKQTLSNMVLEINDTQLEPEDILSNHAYFYDWSTNVLK